MAATSVAGLVLAGGKASRFGGVDKAFIQLAGQTLIEHVLARLQPQVTVTAISANGDPSRFAAFGLPVLPDDPAFQDCGPLTGVLSGLRWAAMQKIEFLLTTPVDTPLLPTTLCARLMPGPAVAVQNGQMHPLTALWPVGFAPALEAFLRQPGKHKVSAALALCAARPVVFAGSDAAFTNINSPADLTAAQAASAAVRGLV